MPQYAFLQLTGTDMGPIKGSCRQQSRKGQIVVIAFEHLIRSERTEKQLTERGGVPNDKRVHGSFVVTKEIDYATPKLHEAMAKGEVMRQCELHCYRVPPAGGGPQGVREENHWTVMLSNARVAAIRTFMPNCRLPQNQANNEYEEVEFTYEHIAFLWKALTGNGASVSTGECPALAADFGKSDDTSLLRGAVLDLGKELGKHVAKEVTDGIKAAAAELTKSK